MTAPIRCEPLTQSPAAKGRRHDRVEAAMAASVT
jgi:hypothetical protein